VRTQILCFTFFAAIGTSYFLGAHWRSVQHGGQSVYCAGYWSRCFPRR
jgi:hypothetical protein